jgi:hypothetical protein
VIGYIGTGLQISKIDHYLCFKFVEIIMELEAKYNIGYAWILVSQYSVYVQSNMSEIH